jgi:hypothetical protein
MSDEEEKPTECECCGYETELTDYKVADPNRKPYEISKTRTAYYCLLCASTSASNACSYPEQYRGETAILRAVCFVGNAIIDEIRKLNVPQFLESDAGERLVTIEPVQGLHDKIPPIIGRIVSEGEGDA